MAKALAGVRVLDLTRMLAGPFCTALLADVGAEVIKVERPGSGDDARQFPPRKGGESGYFMLLNRGKKSVTLDLKAEEGVDVLKRLAARADVVVENFRPGLAKELGVDYARLSRDNQRLVYAAISGFGQEGPLAHRPAYDIIAQAMSGLMSITGHPDGPPTRVGESLGDLVAGLYAAFGVLAALAARERTGRGQYVDVAMLDCVFSLLVTAIAQYAYGGVEPKRVGNRHPISTPFGSFRAGDGELVIAVANDPMFRRFAACIGRPELAQDPRFATDEARTRNEPELKAAIEAWTGRRTVEAAVGELERAGVPAGPIWSVSQAAESEHAKARGLLATLDHPTAGAIRLLRQPVRFSESAGTVERPPPLLGEHTDEVLTELAGLDETAVAGLRARGVI
jgi:crotonobetainyl-CoA:carnitine CoA-transferase CaiB-like acyl-CoA transferase